VSLDNFIDGIKQVAFGDGLAARADSEHTRFCTDGSELSAGGIGAQTSKEIESDVLVHRHGAGGDSENVRTAIEVGKAEFNLSIQTARTQQCGVERVRTVGSHEHLYVAASIETVKLIDDL